MPAKKSTPAKKAAPKKASRKKADGKSAPAKKPATKKISNKEVIYREWEKDPEGVLDRTEALHKKVKQRVKLSTIRAWILMWNRGTGLPACAKKK